MHAIDVETKPFAPGYMAPRVIAVGRDGEIYAADDTARDAIARALDVGAYGFAVSYDMACIANTWPSLLPRIFDAYEAGRIVDLRLRLRLHDFAAVGEARKERGAYSLDGAHKRLNAGEPHTCKDSPWRTRFGELAATPRASWPADAVRYLAEDMRVTRELYAATTPIVDEREQSAYDFALRLMSVWGLRTTEDSVATVEISLLARAEALRGRVGAFLRADGTRDTKAIAEAVTAALGARVKRTPTGAVRCRASDLRDTGVPVLVALADYNETMAAINRELPLLREAVNGCHTRYDLVASGRSSSASPNLQNLNRNGDTRAAFVPRDGFVYLTFDYPALELRTFAQVLIALGCGDTLARALNAGLDPHLDFAADMLGVPYAEALTRYDAGDVEVSRMRQLAKAANFGFPGGLGAKAFRAYAAAAWGVLIDDREAERLRAAWRRKWPEVSLYAQRMGAWVERHGAVEHYRSGRLRGGLSYTAACNTMFQGLGGDVAKATVFAIAKACYVGAMRGSRPALFVHDEIIIETPGHLIDAHARELESIVRAVWSQWVPDVALGDLGILATRRWSKRAKRVVREGRLIPWGDHA